MSADETALIVARSQILFEKISGYIEQAKRNIATVFNQELLLLYWRTGSTISEEILNGSRGKYGDEIVATVSRQLKNTYGSGFSRSAVFRMIQFAELYPNFEQITQISHYLSWSHFVELLTIKDSLQRDFYLQLALIEKWSVRTLRSQMQKMLFERTALSKRPDDTIAQALATLSAGGDLSPDLVFKSPYFLDFLQLKDTYSEKNLEDAILFEIEKFILELGGGFTFVARQKRMIIDGEDHALDLLFYHRKMHRLVAVELKLGKFKAAYKGQMELYLRWLEKNEMETGEELPVGLILCAEGSQETIEYLQLDSGDIRVAEYMTQLPARSLLEQKLHASVERIKARIENLSTE